eukprot:3830768-Prymnesium_polylepis.2
MPSRPAVVIVNTMELFPPDRNAKMAFEGNKAYLDGYSDGPAQPPDLAFEYPAEVWPAPEPPRQTQPERARRAQPGSPPRAVHHAHHSAAPRPSRHARRSPKGPSTRSGKGRNAQP